MKRKFILSNIYNTTSLLIKSKATLQTTNNKQDNMKFSTSTTFTFAAMTLMSSGTDARIGGGQRELHGHNHGHSSHHKWKDPSTYNPTYTP